MKLKTRPLSYMTLALATLAITACGNTPTAQVPGVTVSQERQLATVSIGASVTRDALLAALPAAQILSFDTAAGYAILSVPGESGKLRPASLNSQALRALDASVTTVEADVELAAPSDPVAEGLGVTAWAGGVTAWAGGVTAWAGGVSAWASGFGFNATDLYNLHVFRNVINLPTGQQLAPELGAGVKVAVIDTGVDLAHPLLREQINTAADWDFVGGDATPQEELPAAGLGKYGHGTAVAGVIAQVAPRAEILAYRVLAPDGSSPVSRVVLAVDKAVSSGAKIINLSLGSMEDSTALNTVVAGALAKGILVVNSSGNDGIENMVYPARKLGTGSFTANSGLIAVGSVALGYMKSSFTSYGTGMSLTAHGENVVTSYPGSRLIKATGTSFAAPAVSGALALAVSAGTTNVSTLVADLRATTTPNADPIFRSKLGTGSLNIGAFMDRYR
ncbi:S8 family serine peptidase [Deinococcus sp. YIM 134068]|uniref:S8 family peptidase n=1 Tax=Deinococcus lichenicola TaxID=3118910 RepID=UPI002F9406F6